MGERQGLMPDHRYPRSRDWGMAMNDAPPCRVTKCAANFNGTCVSPSLINIGDDGRCTGNQINRTPEWSTLSEGEKDEAKEAQQD